MIYKFRKPDALVSGFLSTYKDDYTEMYVPNSQEEKFCYVSLEGAEQSKFLTHFLEFGFLPLYDLEEYPGSERSIANLKVHKFLLLKHL